jgi:hypothetical protein
MKGLAEGRKTPRQAAEEPFSTGSGSPSGGGSSSSSSGPGTLPDGVQELMAAISGCGWRTLPPTHVSTSGSKQTWMVKMPMGSSPKQFDVEMTVVDNMPKTIDVSGTGSLQASSAGCQ